MLLWIKQRLIYLNLKRNGTGNGSSNITNTSTERFLLKMLVLHVNVCASPRLFSQVQNMSVKNIKIKYLIPIKNWNIVAFQSQVIKI